MNRESRVSVSPRARRAITRLGLTARDIPGTGPRGRIVEADVLRFAHDRPQRPGATNAGRRPLASPRARRAIKRLGLQAPQIAGTGPNGRIVEADVLKAAGNRLQPAPGESREPMSKMRRAIARRLVEAKQTIPHFYVARTIRAAALADFYKACRQRHPCTLNDVILRAVAIAVGESRPMRSRIEGDELVTSPDANIGIAVGIENGLVVPVLLQADHLSLEALASETRRMIDLARERRVENSGRGVFTISNLGMYGVDEFTAIINPPESGILAVGSLRDAAIVEDGEVRPSKVMTLTLSCDHRVVDGKAAALFLGRVAELLESTAPQLT